MSVNLATGTASDGAGSDILANIEHVIGSAYADTLIGIAANNVLEGGAGNDAIDGGLSTASPARSCASNASSWTPCSPASDRTLRADS